MKKKNLKNNSKIIKAHSKSMNEFELAWKEFFNKKSRPKNDMEEKKEMEEFTYWYNNVRKQSDTGKTPNEMYNAS